MSMIYSKIPEFDVYVHQVERGGVQCTFCSFGDMLEAYFHAESTQEMVDHLAAHAKKGDRMPDHINTLLLQDDPLNYPPKVSPKRF